MKNQIQQIDVNSALRHFQYTDSLMYSRFKGSIYRDNPLLLPRCKPVSEYFPTLVRSIISQQISTKAAASIYKRLSSSHTLRPTSISQFPLTKLQSYGLTLQKAKYIHQLAINWSELKVDDFHQLDDREIIDRLTMQYGIGTWTAQMFLLFAMARPDVFAYNDLGLRQQVVSWYGIRDQNKDTIFEISQRWSPHRSAASLTLWFYIDNGPVLL